MKSNRLHSLTFVLLTAAAARAEVALPGLFGDHMVLQRDVTLPVWGTAQPGEEVTVALKGQKLATKTDGKGNWRVKLQPLPAGGPLELTVTGSNTITLKDVLIGDVWVCSGQSNMEFQVNRAVNAEQEISTADHPAIRLFTVSKRVADKPEESLSGEWRLCSPETIGVFSAVGYFFGRELQQALDVPIGLVNSSWGGTPAEAWTSTPALNRDPDFKPIFARWQRTIADYDSRQGREGANATPPANGGRQAGAQSRPAGQGRRAAGSRPASRPGRRAFADPHTSPQRPSVLYNGMIQPLVPYAIRGVIWYQGEANASYAYLYRKLFPTMIRCWREAWGQGDFPFLFVQLANFKARQTDSFQSDWAELREAQTMTLSLPKTAMAVTIDIGNPGNIHPTNKQDVGKRLALAARAVAYGENLEYSGPMCASMSPEIGRIRVNFAHTAGGLVTRDRAAVKGFAVAGEDRKFVEATALIDGNSILVLSPQVAKPVAVRYAWADSPECNLMNGAGLPASPFRTDDWPGVTDGKK